MYRSIALKLALFLVFFLSSGVAFAQIEIVGEQPIPVEIQAVQNIPPASLNPGITAIVVFLIICLLVAYILLIIAILKYFKTIPRNSALVYGWHQMRKNLKFFVILVVILGIIGNTHNILDFIIRIFNKEYLTGTITISLLGKSFIFDHKSIFLAVLGFFFTHYASVSFLSTGLKVASGNEVKVKDSFAGVRLYIRYLITAIPYYLITVAGVLLFVVPGVIFGTAASLWPYLVVEKNQSPIECIRESIRLTKGKRWELFLFLLLIQAITLLGMVAILVGPFITAPFTLLAGIYIYRTLSGKAPISATGSKA